MKRVVSAFDDEQVFDVATYENRQRGSRDCQPNGSDVFQQDTNEDSNESKYKAPVEKQRWEVEGAGRLT